jgi:hypothetical protein
MPIHKIHGWQFPVNNPLPTDSLSVNRISQKNQLLHVHGLLNHWIFPIDQSGCFVRATVIFTSTEQLTHDKGHYLHGKGMSTGNLRLHTAVDQS